MISRGCAAEARGEGVELLGERSPPYALHFRPFTATLALETDIISGDLHYHLSFTNIIGYTSF